MGTALTSNPPSRWAWQHRGLVVLTGVTCLVWADRFRLVPDVHLVVVWPLMFLAAGVACFTLAAWPQLEHARPVSGALVVGGAVSRAVTVWWSTLDGTTTLQDPRAHLAMATWLFVAAVVGWVWTYALPR